ncbi:MAG: hypothetical protein QG564_900 [Campylobacterota bacterium]|nr:hypothetical protein [Campylobacterota bacterium]
MPRKLRIGCSFLVSYREIRNERILFFWFISNFYLDITLFVGLGLQFRVLALRASSQGREVHL